MKTTVDIHDVLLDRAKRHARERGKTLRQVIEAGLRAVLDEPPSKYEYDWPDLSVGEPGAPYPLDAWTWQDLSELIYRRESGGAPPAPPPSDATRSDARPAAPAVPGTAASDPSPESPERRPSVSGRSGSR